MSSFGDELDLALGTDEEAERDAAIERMPEGRIKARLKNARAKGISIKGEVTPEGGYQGPLPSEEPESFLSEIMHHPTGFVQKAAKFALTGTTSSVEEQDAEEAAAHKKAKAQMAPIEAGVRSLDRPDVTTGEVVAGLAKGAAKTALVAGAHPFELAGDVVAQVPVLGEPIRDVTFKILGLPFELAHATKKEVIEAFPEKFDPNTPEGRRNLDLIEVGADVAGLIIMHKAAKAVKGGVEALDPTRGPAVLPPLDVEFPGPAELPPYVPPPSAIMNPPTDPALLARTPVAPPAPPSPANIAAKAEMDARIGQVNQVYAQPGAPAAPPPPEMPPSPPLGPPPAPPSPLPLAQGMLDAPLPPPPGFQMGQPALPEPGPSPLGPEMDMAKEMAPPAVRAAMEAKEAALGAGAPAEPPMPTEPGQPLDPPVGPPEAVAAKAETQIVPTEGKVPVQVPDIKSPPAPAEAVTLYGGFQGWYEAAKGLVRGVQYAPRLKKFKVFGADISAADAHALAMNAIKGGSRSAVERSVSVQYGLDATDLADMRQYLTAKSEAGLARAGKKTAGNKTEPQLDREVLDAARRVTSRPGGTAKLQRVEQQFREWGDEVYDRLKQAGYDPGYRDDYAPRLVRDWYEDMKSQQLMGTMQPKKVGRTFTPSVKEAKGSVREIEEDPFLAMSYADFMSRKALHSQRLATSIADANAITGGVLNRRIPYDPEKHALYSFGGPGGPEMKAPVAGQVLVNETLRTMKPNSQRTKVTEVKQVGIDANGDPIFTSKVYEVLPRELAEGLVEGNQAAELGPVTSFLARSMGFVKDGLLKWNPQFTLSQIPEDYFTALYNVPVMKWPEFHARLKAATAEVGREMHRVIVKGEYSKKMEQWRDSGLLTEGVTTLLDNAEPTHVVTSEGTPYYLRGFEGKVAKASEAAGGLSQWRETALKKALGETFEGMGASAERAAIWSNRVMGNYIKVSPVGRWVTSHLPLTKWYIEQLLRLTVDFATDPVTGKGPAAMFKGQFAEPLRGFISGPIPKIAAAWFLKYLANNVGRSEEDRQMAANLPSYLKGGIVTGKNEDGTFNVVMTPGLDRFAHNFVDSVFELVHEPGSAAGEIVDALAARVNPVLRVPPEAIAGKHLFGKPLEPAWMEGMSTQAKEDYRVKQGGIPWIGYRGEHILNSVAALPRIIGGLWSQEEAIQGPKAVKTARVFGLPLYTTDPTALNSEQLRVYGKAWLQRWVDALDSQDWDEAAVWSEKLMHSGYNVRTMQATLRKGMKNEALAEFLSAEQRKAYQNRRIIPEEAK